MCIQNVNKQTFKTLLKNILAYIELINLWKNVQLFSFDQARSNQIQSNVTLIQVVKPQPCIKLNRLIW